MSSFNDNSPKGWVSTNLGELVQPSKERIIPEASKMFTYIGLEHIEKDIGKIIGYGKSDEVTSTKSIFHKGDLLYGKLRPYLNKVTVPEFDGICSTDILVFSQNPYTSNKYLQYRLLCRDFVRFANQNATGVNHPRIDYKQISQFPINLPPLAEQHRIVAKIEELFTKLDAGVGSLKKAKEQLCLYRQSIIDDACSGIFTEHWRIKHTEFENARQVIERFQLKNKNVQTTLASNLPRLNEKWTWASLDEIRDIEKNSITDGPFGSNLKTEHYTASGPRVIRLQNIGCGHFIEEKAYISKERFELLKKHQIFSGDIVIAALGNPLPRACIIPEYVGQAIVKADCIRFKPNPELAINSYILYAINQPSTQKRVSKQIHGVGRARLNLSGIKSITIPLPPIEEQKVIVSEIEGRLAVLYDIEKSIDNNLVYVKTLSQSILAQAFSGKLVPQNPDDEPADKLLERIRAELVILSSKKKSYNTDEKPNSKQAVLS